MTELYEFVEDDEERYHILEGRGHGAMARELLAIDEGYKAEYDEFSNIINRELTSCLYFQIGREA